MATKGEQEWIEVSRRRKVRGNSGKQWDTNRSRFRGETSKTMTTTSFFFSEIPEQYGAREMYDIFKDFGDIDEVIFPPRRDKRGKRFGFVRFFNVLDERLLAVKLDNIFIGSRKIHANIPRFNRESRSGRDRRMDQQLLGKRREHKVAPKEQNQDDRRNGFDQRNNEGQGARQRLSYAQTVRGAQNNKTVIDRQVHTKKIPFAHLEYNMEEEDLERFQKAFVGVVEVPGDTYNLQERFTKEGYFGVKVTPMGANLCLLEENEEGMIKDIIEEAREWIQQWFSEIRPWRANDVDNERATWLRVYGLPCHAWKDKVFEFLATSVETFICADEVTRKHKNMDVARILIRTKYCLVLNETYNISINDNVFRIKVVEDNHGPLRIALNHEGKIMESKDSDEVSEEWNDDSSDGDMLSFVQESVEETTGRAAKRRALRESTLKASIEGGCAAG
ncbi:uncharacterized protein LOC131605070 [Vicia villosa]|uniref:uncharacterized protein LOC131605070 n=1 Tax=Vicia villosa TaxID=3911 RepID=UPI00273AA306|nr:uncharacterized protein LOC131605070 [Vicia villosa]